MDNLLGMLPQDLVAALAARGVTCDEPEARRVLAHLISYGASDLSRMKRPPRREVREAIAGLSWVRPEVVERVADPHDRSLRYLLRSPDGSLSEAVRIALERPGRYTVCLSSQVGCAMACDFCATGRLGLSRNLEPWEMVGAFLTVRDELGPDERLTGAVFMGQGEPLHNYDRVIQAAQVLSRDCGGRISAKAITISTVGLVPQIRRYTAEGHPYRLIVSLTSAVPERRATLLPVAGRYPLPDLAAALKERAEATRDRVTVAWVLIGGLNDGADEAWALAELTEGFDVRVNLIDVNDPRPDGYRRSTDDERGAFLDALRVVGAPVIRRYSVGRESNSACGMLAAKRGAEPAGA